MLTLRVCSQDDVKVLAQMNRTLTEDEKSDVVMTPDEFERRMADFLITDYKAFFFLDDGVIVGYALVNMTTSPLYLRQFFICREARRKGFGTMAIDALLNDLGTDEIDIDVYAWNKRGISFWKSLGFAERFHRMRLKR